MKNIAFVIVAVLGVSAGSFAQQIEPKHKKINMEKGVGKKKTIAPAKKETQQKKAN